MEASEAPAPGPRRPHQVVPPTLLPNGLEVSLHALPKAMRPDVGMVFPGVDVASPGFFVVPTCQHCPVDLMNWGPDAARAKDELLERFMNWAAVFRSTAVSSGLVTWVDYIDPCSGLPVHTPNVAIVYPEVPALEQLLKYRIDLAGGCKVIVHPRWGTAVYPATLFLQLPAGADAAAASEAIIALAAATPAPTGVPAPPVRE